MTNTYHTQIYTLYITHTKHSTLYTHTHTHTNTITHTQTVTYRKTHTTHKIFQTQKDTLYLNQTFYTFRPHIRHTKLTHTQTHLHTHNYRCSTQSHTQVIKHKLTNLQTLQKKDTRFTIHNTQHTPIQHK